MRLNPIDRLMWNSISYLRWPQTEQQFPWPFQFVIAPIWQSIYTDRHHWLKIHHHGSSHPSKIHIARKTVKPVKLGDRSRYRFLTLLDRLYPLASRQSKFALITFPPKLILDWTKWTSHAAYLRTKKAPNILLFRAVWLEKPSGSVLLFLPNLCPS